MSSPQSRRTVAFKVDVTGRSTRIPASRRDRKASRPPADGPWVWLTRELMSTDAWQTLSINERRVIERPLIEHMNHAGTMNGQLRVSHRQFITWGVTKNMAAPAIHGLQARGLVRITPAESNGDIRGYYQYRLTFLPADYSEPTNEWRSFRAPELA
jgi:hypothetical protein